MSIATFDYREVNSRPVGMWVNIFFQGSMEIGGSKDVTNAAFVQGSMDIGSGSA